MLFRPVVTTAAGPVTTMPYPGDDFKTHGCRRKYLGVVDEVVEVPTPEDTTCQLASDVINSQQAKRIVFAIGGLGDGTVDADAVLDPAHPVIHEAKHACEAPLYDGPDVLGNAVIVPSASSVVRAVWSTGKRKIRLASRTRKGHKAYILVVDGKIDVAIVSKKRRSDCSVVRIEGGDMLYCSPSALDRCSVHANGDGKPYTLVTIVSE